MLVPFIQLFALYVIVHGPFGPGGGFQGGAILAASVMLMRLTLGQPLVSRPFGTRLMRRLGAAGLLVYGGVGLVPVLLGRPYLDYSGLPIPGLSDPLLRASGILLVEVGIAMGVLGILVMIFDRLVGEEG